MDYAIKITDSIETVWLIQRICRLLLEMGRVQINEEHIKHAKNRSKKLAIILKSWKEMLEKRKEKTQETYLKLVPLNVLKDGEESIQNFLKDSAKAYNDIKHIRMCLLGNSGVGKTRLEPLQSTLYDHVLLIVL